MAKSVAAERSYESLFICPSDTPQKTIDTFIEKIKTAIQPTKGILRGVQVWGRRRLTYPIKHQKDGLYIFIDFTGEKGTVESLRKLYHVSDFILRHLTTDKVNLRPPYVRKSPTESAEGAAPAAAGAAPATATAAPATEATKVTPS
jgi:small subunit ribosomal protein S6